jgi:hypothetical protein
MNCSRCGSSNCRGTCTTPRFRKGQQVHVEFDGEVNEVQSNRIFVRGEGQDFTHRVYFGAPGVTVTLTDPVGYPVQLGDVWATTAAGNITEWFTVRNAIGGLSMSPDDSTGRISPEQLKDMNPTLIRRRGQ